MALTRVLISGCQGKMGKIAADAVKQCPHLEWVGGTESTDQLRTALCTQTIDVVVDLTTPSVVFEHTCLVIEHSVHPVIGTSGLTPTQIDQLRTRCQDQHLGGLFVPNFSLAAVMMMKFARLAAPYFQGAEIIEMHHPKKKDAPSGTARITQQWIEAESSEPVPIHSVRLPGLLANQAVYFGGEDETLEIHHRSLSRQSFMPGLLLACQHVVSLNTFEVGLDHCLFLSSD